MKKSNTHHYMHKQQILRWIYFQMSTDCFVWSRLKSQEKFNITWESTIGKREISRRETTSDASHLSYGLQNNFLKDPWPLTFDLVNPKSNQFIFVSHSILVPCLVEIPSLFHKLLWLKKKKFDERAHAIWPLILHHLNLKCNQFIFVLQSFLVPSLVKIPSVVHKLSW